MAETNMPYVMATGQIRKVLEAVKRAQTPDRFTQDFLVNTLHVKTGSAKMVIPFLKKTAFLGADGTPTDLYKRFRNPTQSGAAAAEALKNGYRQLYEMNERVHELNDADLKGLIVQATGLSDGVSTLAAVIGSFKTLREFASFDEPAGAGSAEASGGPADASTNGATGATVRHDSGAFVGSIKLGYTINLNLPATSDVAVFDAIFTSLRQHLLQ